MIETIVLDVGETVTRDDRYWGSWADWLGVPRHTLSALVGAVVAQGRDNADAVRIARPGIDLAAAAQAREAVGRGEYLDETDLYDDVRPALAACASSAFASSSPGTRRHVWANCYEASTCPPT